MLILSLCTGKTDRWDLSGIKQLIDIKGEPLLKRTIRQFKEKGEDITIVTDDNNLKIGNYFIPEKGRCGCETLLNTKELWKDKVIVLLGDVLYSDNLVNKILKCNDEFRIFGNWEEIYAVVFKESVFEKVIKELIIAIKVDVVKSNLWDFAQAYLGGKRKDYLKREFEYIKDYTQDFDDKRDVDKYNKNLKKYNYE